MTRSQSCFSCGERLPRNYESLETCPSCGTELWDDEPAGGEMDGKVIGAAIGAAILGAVVWAGIAIKTDYEIGWVAWGIGALVGFGTMKAGGIGMRPAVLAAVLAALSILGGRIGATHYSLNASYDAYLEGDKFQGELLDLKSDALDYSHLKGEVDDETLTKFLVVHKYSAADGSQDFDAESLASARANLIPLFKQVRTPTGELNYIEEVRADIKAEYGLLDALKDSLDLVDALFLVLGVGTAFKMVLGRG
ncbi:MAG: hypothetical protein GY930_13310 [bacterium]|nr:hypothetical protein [bacterium]